MPAAAPPTAPRISNNFMEIPAAAAPAIAAFDMFIDVEAVCPWCDAVTLI
jgi:hypothetical protein